LRKFVGMTIFVALMLSLLAGYAFAQAAPSVELHGYMQNRFYVPESSQPRFGVERVSLSAAAKLPSEANAYVEIYLPVQPSSALYLESGYVDLKLGNGRLRVGKGRQLNFGITPTYPNRKTSQYGILAETFTQDRIQGLQYAYKAGAFDGGVSFFTDLTGGTRQIGTFPGAFNSVDAAGIAAPVFGDTQPHLCDGEPSGAAGTNARLAGSAKIGVSTPTWNAHISYATGGLSQTNANAVAKPWLGVLTHASTTHNKCGIDATYGRGPWVGQVEAYQATFGEVKLNGYSVLAGYQPKDTWRAYVRYASIVSNLTPVAASPSTYDPQQLTFAVIKPLFKGVWIECDYEKNVQRVPRGGRKIDDGLFFVELFTGF